MSHDNIIEAIDPRGNRVTCSRQRWEEHIIKGSDGGTGHSDMHGREQEVKSKVEWPDVIMKSSRHPSGEVYFGRTEQGEYLKIVVDAKPAGPYTIITAFTQEHIGGGITDKILYVKPKL